LIFCSNWSALLSPPPGAGVCPRASKLPRQSIAKSPEILFEFISFLSIPSTRGCQYTSARVTPLGYDGKRLKVEKLRPGRLDPATNQQPWRQWREQAGRGHQPGGGREWKVASYAATGLPQPGRKPEAARKAESRWREKSVAELAWRHRYAWDFENPCEAAHEDSAKRQSRERSATVTSSSLRHTCRWCSAAACGRSRYVVLWNMPVSCASILWSIDSMTLGFMARKWQPRSSGSYQTLSRTWQSLVQ